MSAQRQFFLLFRKILRWIGRHGLILGVGGMVAGFLLLSPGLLPPVLQSLTQLRDAEEALTWSLLDRVLPGKQDQISDPEFVWILEDQSSWNAWGRPPIFPRDKLALILSRLCESGPLPRLIIVDLSLTDRNPGDPELIRTLRNLPVNHPPILFMETFVPGEKHTLERLPSVLDPMLDETGSGLFKTTGVYFPDWLDRKIRQGRLMTAYWKGDTPEVAYHAAFLSALLLDKPGLSEEKLRSRLVRMNQASAACERTAPGSIHQCMLENLTDADSGFSLGPDSVELRDGLEPRRIVFDPRFSAAGNGIDLLSAGQISEKNSVLTPFSRRWDGKVVLIGSDTLQSPDRHQSPIGALKGVALLVQDIHSLQSYGRFKGLHPLWQWCTIMLALIVMLALEGNTRIGKWRFLLTSLLWLMLYGVIVACRLDFNTELLLLVLLLSPVIHGFGSVLGMVKSRLAPVHKGFKQWLEE